MEILIAGGSGFIGRHLIHFLKDKGHHIHLIGRKDFGSATILKQVRQKDMIINLVGEPVSGRWTRLKKKKILTSRINTTQSLVKAVHAADEWPQLFVQASAIGIYDNIGRHDEQSSNFAGDFLADVVQKWERAAEGIGGNNRKTRLIILRLGVVLGRDGGVIKKLLLPLRFRLGIQTGSGRQVCSFIQIQDLAEAIYFLLEHKNIEGIVNVVSPERVSWAHLHRLLAKMLKPFVKITIPDFVLKLIFGEGASIIIKGQDVIPGVLEKEGFVFQYAALDKALTEILLKN